MALDFISSLFNKAPQALQLLNVMGTTKELGRGTPAQREAAVALQQRNKLLTALQDPDSVLFKNIEAERRGELTKDFQRALRDLTTQERLQTALGRQGFFDPERRDEAMSRLFTRQAQDVGPASRAAARNFMTALAGQYGETAGMQQRQADIERLMLAQKFGGKMATYGLIDKLLGGAMSAGGGGRAAPWINPDNMRMGQADSTLPWKWQNPDASSVPIPTLRPNNFAASIINAISQAPTVVGDSGSNPYYMSAPDNPYTLPAPYNKYPGIYANDWMSFRRPAPSFNAFDVFNRAAATLPQFLGWMK